MVQIGKVYGVLGCVILIGVGIWGGQAAGEKVGELGYDTFEKYVLQPLP